MVMRLGGGAFRLLVLALLVACGEPEMGTIVADSSGVTVVRTRTGDSFARAAVVIEEEPIFQIGQSTSDPSYMILDYWGARRLASGELAIADGNPISVRLYDTSGIYVREIARGGTEPDQIRSIFNFGSYADTIVICCGNGVLFYSNTGEFLGRTEESLRAPSLVLRDGSWIERRGRYGPDFYARQRELLQLSIVDTLFRTSRHDTTRVLLGAYQRMQELYMFNNEPNPLGETVLRIDSPFLPRSDIGASPDGYYYATGEVLGADAYDFSGRLIRSFRVELSPRRISSAQYRTFRDDWINRGRDAEQRSYLRWMLGEAPRPRVLPWTDEMQVAADGATWLRQHDYPRTEDATWHIFRPDGTYAGYTTLPAAWRLQQVGDDFILTARRIEEEGAIVELRRLRWE